MHILYKILDEFALLGISFLSAALVVTVHEYIHALTSWKLGDRLPKFNRRLTLNPLPHIDIVGILFFIQTGFGWGNPVETSPKNYKDKKKGSILVGVSGPLASLALAIIAIAGIEYLKIQTLTGALVLAEYTSKYLTRFLYDVHHFSFYLAFISLIPMHPFDGLLVWSKVISSKVQFKIYQYQNIMLTLFFMIILISPESIKMLLEPIRKLIELSIYGIVRLIV